MKTYTTKSTVTIGQGKLGLNLAQASRCGSALADLGDGIFEILSPVQFKAGETFSHDMPIPKTIAHCLEEAEEPEALEDLDTEQLRAMATSLEAKFHPNTGKPKLIEIIKTRQVEMLAERKQAELDQLKAERIAELEVIPERTEAEQAELDQLKA